jgi:hypothetical protein
MLLTGGQKLLLTQQREALTRMSKERIKCLKNFVEENVMESRKFIQKKIKFPRDKKEIRKTNIVRMKQAYQHPFEKIDESVYTDKP